jgi:hypothetical protein
MAARELGGRYTRTQLILQGQLLANIASLTMSAVSPYSSTPLPALRKERHFALVDGVAFPTVGSLVIVFRSGMSDPCISSVATTIMITTSNSSVKRSRTPNQFLGVLLHTITMSRVRTELDPLRVIPLLTPHSIQPNLQLEGHRDLGGFRGRQSNY